MNIDFLSADVIRLFKDAPEVRRRSINRFCSQYFSEYKSLITQYDRLVRQKNKTIKTTGDVRNVKLWNPQLVRYAADIVAFRLEGLSVLERKLNPFANDVLGDLYQTMSLEYDMFRIEMNPFSKAAYAEKLQEKLDANVEKEMAIGYSIYGPHRDDIGILLNGKSLFSFFSRGINRIMAIGFVLSQIQILSDRKKSVLLLDDTFAELDIGMKTKLAAYVSGSCQVFYTTVLEEDKGLFPELKTVIVNEGNVNFEIA